MSTTAKALKILVVGDVQGDFDILVDRVNSISKKTSFFDMLLCVGEFFGDDSKSEQLERLKSGELSIPFLTIVMSPSLESNVSKYEEDPEAQEDSVIAPNVHFLGKLGTWTAPSGLTIVYLGGKEGNTPSKCIFTQTEVQGLMDDVNSATFKGVDILLTSEWPHHADRWASKAAPIDTNVHGSNLVSQLANIVKPRYHFCGTHNAYFQRSPYRNHLSDGLEPCHVTRFLGLACVNSSNKKNRYIYGFNIIPMASLSRDTLIEQPIDATSNPYIAKQEATNAPVKATGGPTQPVVRNGSKNIPFGQHASQSQEAQSFRDNFFFDTKMSYDKKKPQRKDGRRNPFKRDLPPSECWFCLSSPDLAKHLIVSCGDSTYLAMAKGPLVPEHVLILPIAHHRSLADTPEATLLEVEAYKSALTRMFDQLGQIPVFYERNVRSVHTQLQVIPVPKQFEPQLPELFISKASESNVRLSELPRNVKLSDIASNIPYYTVFLPSGVRYFARVDRDAQRNFPLHLGRDIVADLLRLKHKTDWKECTQTKEEEVVMTERFRTIFEPYDFTLDDSDDDGDEEEEKQSKNSTDKRDRSPISGKSEPLKTEQIGSEVIE